MQLAIVSSSATAPGATKLRDAAQQLGYDASIVVIGTDDIVAELHKTDKAILRIGPKSYKLYVDLMQQISPAHRPLFKATLLAFDKDQTFHTLTKHAIPTPNTYILKADLLPKEYPVVIKIIRGNQGKGVELLHDENDYRQFLAIYNDQERFIAQEFIAEADKQDKRLLVVGNECIAAMRRRSSGTDFRANLHTGGVAEAYKPTDEEIAMALRATKAFGLPFAGVDIIDSMRGPLVLEVNPSPGLAIGDVVGIDVAKKIVEGVMKI